MTRITTSKELEQFDQHKYNSKPTAEDKAYQTFINSIFDEDGQLNKIGGRSIPETVVEVCRVLNAEDKKEYLVYDVHQWGWLEDGRTKSPTVHIQDIGTWRKYEWEQRPLPQAVYTGTPQKRQFKDYPTTSNIQYDIPFTPENIEKVKAKCNNTTRLYVYDTSRSGKGGRDGKIGVDNWEDFVNRDFKELIEGTYLMKTQMATQMEALKQREEYIKLREKINQQEEERLARERVALEQQQEQEQQQPIQKSKK